MKKVLKKTIKFLNEKDIELSVTDIADVLWLYSIMEKENKVLDAKTEKKNEILDETLNENDKSFDKTKIDEVGENKDSSSLHRQEIEPVTEESTSKGYPFSVPTRKHYNYFNQFATVLKVLREFYNSSSEYEFDEHETVEYIVNTGIFDIVEKPKKELKYTLYIIIEISTSMSIWDELNYEFISALSRFSFFKKVNVLYLKEGKNKYRLFRDKECHKKSSIKIFDSFEKRNLTMLLTDCVSMGWRDNRGYKFLNKITKLTPFMIVNMLPQRMWVRTALHKTWRVNFTHKTNWNNKNLVSDIDNRLDRNENKIKFGEHLRIPMTTLDTLSFKHWANLVSGKRNNLLNGSIFEATVFKKENAINPTVPDRLKAEDLVNAFYSYSSPMAQKLMIYFSAVDLNMEIMKMVQRTSLPQSNHTHLAEVFLSGLLKRSDKDKNIFDFKEGVRDILLDRLYPYKIKEIQEKNAEFIKKSIGFMTDFSAIIKAPNLTDGINIPDNSKPFAYSGEEVENIEYNESNNNEIIVYSEKDLDVNLISIVNYLNEICTYLTFKVGKETFALEEKKISWSESYKNLSSAIHKETKYSIGAFFFTKKAYNNNYFFEGNTHYKNLMIISFSGWNSLTTLPYSNAIAYFVAKVLSLDLSNYQHQESTGCLYDFSAKKDDIDKNMREAYICKDCYSRIEKNKSDKNMKILKDIENILEVVGRASIYDLDILNKNSLFMQNNIKLEYSWLKFLQEEFDKSYMKNLNIFLREEKRQGKKILPKASLWFNALNLTPINQVKVVILGQDPYPTIGYAHGLSFSVLPDVKPLPKSLLNINKELLDDLGIDNFHTGYLQPWTKQGVLLLNSVLTVEAGKSNSHQGKGWEIFTDKIIEVINRECNNIVFILWGSHAQKKGSVIDTTKHLIIKSPNPSPLSAYRGFFGSKPFSRTNSYLKKNNKQTINWNLDFNTLQCDELKQYTVKIEYQGIKGSGFIVKLDKFSNNFFVFTAKHIFESLDIDINEVLIQYEDEVITPREKISLETDMIVFIFDNSISQRISNLKLIPLSSNPNQFKESIFVGYSRDNLVCQKCIYSHALEKENLYTVKSTQQYNMQDIIGVGGSGLFIKENGQYSIVGMIVQYDKKVFDFKYIALAPLIEEIINKVELIQKENLDSQIYNEKKGLNGLDNNKYDLNPKELFYRDLNNIQRFLKLLLMIFKDNILEEKINILEVAVSDLHYRISAYDFGFIDFILAKVNMIDYSDIFIEDNDERNISLLLKDNPHKRLIIKIHQTSDFLISLYKHLSYEEDYLENIKALEYKEDSFDKEINKIILSSDNLISSIQNMNLEELTALLNKENNILNNIEKVSTPIEEVINYLKQNKNYIIIDIVKKIENNVTIYINELKEKRIEFIESINKHFEWMIKLLYELDDKKNNINNLLIIDSLYPAYCDFYQEFSLHIKDIEYNEEVKKILERLINSISEKYKCN